MSMKTLSDPRRVYTRNGYTHVLYAGDVFGSKDSNISTNHPVRIAGNKDGTITVTQSIPKRKGVTEKWTKVRVPCHARA